MKNKNIALTGFADLSDIDTDSRFGLRYGISVAIALNPQIVSDIPNGPSMDYYNEYAKVSGQLRAVCAFLAERIQERGFTAKSLYCYKQNEQYRTPLPFKTLATRSGLGWIGKPATLITRQYGSAIRLGGILTDMPLKTGEPVNYSDCGDCAECVNHCPGDAIMGKQWEPGVDRDALLNPYRCKETTIKRGKALNITEGSCGVCLAVCPWTKKYTKAQE